MKITNQYAKQRMHKAFLTSKLLKKQEEDRKQQEMFWQLDYEYEKELKREELEEIYSTKNLPRIKKD
jgi:hypothetical protein